MNYLMSIQNPYGQSIPAEEVYNTNALMKSSAVMVFPTRSSYDRLDRSVDMDAVDETIPQRKSTLASLRSMMAVPHFPRHRNIQNKLSPSLDSEQANSMPARVKQWRTALNHQYQQGLKTSPCPLPTTQVGCSPKSLSSQ